MPGRSITGALTCENAIRALCKSEKAKLSTRHAVAIADKPNLYLAYIQSLFEAGTVDY